jgi:broad specificity phosphatase PhoE
VPLRLFARAFSIGQSLVRLVFDRLPLLSVGGSPPPPPPLPTGPQTLLLVRHGQSMHNIASVAKYGDTGADASLFDAPLSPLGETQVAALAGHELLAKAELIISSPLTRAVQTLFGAFPPLSGAPPAPVELWPLVSEHLTDSCDIGTGAAELAKRFPTLHASTLPEVWWYTGGVQETAAGSRERYRECGFMEPELMFIGRVDAFVEKLRQRPESVIAIFGHSDFFNYLMERHCAAHRDREQYGISAADQLIHRVKHCHVIEDSLAQRNFDAHVISDRVACGAAAAQHSHCAPARG